MACKLAILKDFVHSQGLKFKTFYDEGKVILFPV